VLTVTPPILGRRAGSTVRTQRQKSILAKQPGLSNPVAAAAVIAGDTLHRTPLLALVSSHIQLDA